MTVHSLYLFDRNGICLHYSEWNRKKQAGISKEEEFKLMYGMLFSIRSFVSKMSPLDMKEGFLSFQTSKYKLHYYETPTGLKVVMNTDLGVGNIRDVLHQIYSYVTSGRVLGDRPVTLPSGKEIRAIEDALESSGVGLALTELGLACLCLVSIYVEYVVKNPLCNLNEPIQSELFRSKLDTFIRSLPFFSARGG